MKKCQNCGFENTDLMNFCMECGTSLAQTGVGEQKTASFTNSQTVAYNPNTPPTNPNSEVETETAVRSRYTPPIPHNSTPHTVVQNQFSPTPKMPPNQGNSKMLLIVGGILALVILGGAGIIGVGAIAYFSQREVVDNPPPPTPVSSPFPNQSPRISTPTPPTLKDTPTTSNGTAKGEYQDMWVDYNVRENGKLGMMVHVSFMARNMKGVDSYLAIYLQKNDGTPVYGNTPGFVSKTKQVAAFKLLRPAYDPAEYKDTQIFIPYTAFGLPRGKYNLQLNVNLIYKTDGLISQLNVYDFEFEQK